MGLSNIEFTSAEMREMEKAAEESFHRKPHEKAVLPPKGVQLAALKRIPHHYPGHPCTPTSGTKRQAERLSDCGWPATLRIACRV